MKHTSLSIIYYGSITRHYTNCSRCLRRSAGNGCHLGKHLWSRYISMRKVEARFCSSHFVRRLRWESNQGRHYV